MTAFFAMPEETAAWLAAEAERLDVFLHEDTLPGGGRRSFLWPRSEPPLPPPVRGVQVLHPVTAAGVLSQGDTAWQPSAFYEQTAAVGQRLSRALTRSLRTRATEPLFAMSLDGTAISPKPSAWATPAALDSGLRLRQFVGAGCWFVTGD